METKRIEQLIKQFENARLVLIANQNSENKKLTHETLALIENIKLELLTKLYSMETKRIKISELIPQGYEIDKEKSTFENIILKPIEDKLPLSVSEILNLQVGRYNNAFNALRQLLYLRDAWNGDWKADWENVDTKHCIYFFREKIDIEENTHGRFVLSFKTKELAKKFATKFKDLINEAKELL